ncbi:MAG: hypothetical protein SVU94_12670 [Bacteroidota bacterium]|nr:hypothetical protein [Bacteroidota bacterium]
MEACIINLNQTADKGRRFKRFILILSLVFLASAIGVTWLLYQKHDMETWIFISLGIYFLLFLYFGYIGYNAKMFIRCDDFALEYQFGFFKKIPEKIIWETVDKVKLGFTSITFFKKSGRKKVLKIGWVPYEKLKIIKNNVHSFCAEKRIPIEVAEYKQQE